MPNFKLLYILFIGGLLALSSCRDCHEKGNCDPEYYRYDLGEARDYLWAAAGSYWIYRNTKTGELDTQTCLSAKTYWVNDHGSTKYSQHITVDYEVLLRVLKSSYNGWLYEDKTSFYNPDAMRTQKTFVDRNVYGEGINNPFWHPMHINEKGGTSSSVTTCVNTDTTIQINTTLYDSVAVFEIDMDDIWYPNSHPIVTRYPKARYYWVKTVGLIMRRNLSQSYSWELIDYKILP